MMKVLFTLLMVGLLFPLGCGKDSYNDDDDGYTQPAPEPDPEPEAPGWDDAVVVLTTSCAGANCHSGGRPRDAVIETADAFLDSAACSRIRGGSMPPDDRLGEEDKQLLLAYCQANGK